MATDLYIPHIWNEKSLGPISEESIKKLHTPADKFRISKCEYEVGELVHGKMKAGICYVLKGRGKFVFKDTDILVNAGTYTDFPAGSYTFKNTGKECFTAFFSWKLPF